MIKKVAVIGSGTMGSGIAGQVANAGIDVWILDLPSNEGDVNAIAQKGLDRLKDPSQPGLMSDAAEKHIHLGNIRDDLNILAECDWVAEAVVERLDIKHQLYAQLAQHMNPEAILSSNTSTIPISLLTQGMDESLKTRFAISHFFNPVRFMRLLELVRGEHTEDSVMQSLTDFCEEKLGKGIVPCIDTPGFLANRLGVFAIQCALHEAFKANMEPQIADSIFGRPMGIPKTGVFGLYDLIGIDLMSDVVKSLVSILPEEDSFHAVAQPIDTMTRMISNGQTGNKQGKGFYTQDSEQSAKKVLDFQSHEYKLFDRPAISIVNQAEQEGIRCLIDSPCENGRYAWQVLSRTLCYAANMIPEVGDNPAAIDEAMKLGYNWIKGPFEIIDEISLEYFVKRLRSEGYQVPALLLQVVDDGQAEFYRVKDGHLQSRQWCTAKTQPNWRPIVHAPGVTRFSEVRQTLLAKNRNQVASWYEYEGAALVEFHSKANALNGDSMAILDDALNQVRHLGLKGLIVHNDAQHFSCGVNLESIRGFINTEDYDGLDAFLNNFQQTVHKMSTAKFPVIAAPSGLSIGGGFEVVLHAQYLVSHANSTMGLVESLVGLVPGGGGCKETLYRWQEKLALPTNNIEKASWKAFMNLGYGVTATSPQSALNNAMITPNDTYLMNRDRLLPHALNMLDEHNTQRHRARPDLQMPGKDTYTGMNEWLHKAYKKSTITKHDAVVGQAIAGIVSGGDIEAATTWSEQDLFDAERRAFISLVKTPETRARIDSMLDLGRSLRN